MKSKYLLVWALLISTCSCAKWLNVDPSDIVSEEKLFDVGMGYHVALNGVFKIASSPELYGRELTWGLISAFGGDYRLGYSDGVSYYHPYYKAASSYQYKDVEVLKLFDHIWQQAYSVIANCNNLLKNIKDEDPAKFAMGEIEKNLIIGEAMAMRAMLHLDILRLFAPAKDDGEVWIPYYDQDGLSTGQHSLKVSEILERVIADLTEAQRLVEPYDNLDMSRKIMMTRDYRFSPTFYKDIDIAEYDLFFTCRGYRMNYFAITALLARAYNYNDEHEKAYQEARKVIDYKVDDGVWQLFSFSILAKADTDKKTMDDLIFCMGDPRLYDNYQPYTISTGSNAFLTLSPEVTSNFDDPADYRATMLIGTGDLTRKISLKYIKPAKESTDSKVNADILPLIRLSELYYIQAEYEASKGLWDDAAKSLDMVRMGRNCTSGRLGITDQATFEKELLREARREFFSEGQTYFYYKKMGIVVSNRMKPEHFIFPKPTSEDVQI